MKRKEAEEQQIHFFPEPRAAIASVNGGLSRYPRFSIYPWEERAACLRTVPMNLEKS